MSEHASTSKIMERLVAGICLALAFLVLASVIVPDQSHAEDDHHDDAGHVPHHHPGDTSIERDGSHTPDSTFGAASLGSIESGAYRLEIFAGDHGPFYTVIETATDAVLGERLTADEIASQFPDLEIPSMNIEDGTGPLMMADDDEYLAW